ncbi:MAG: ATP-binding cassette domain-containing protein [Prevotellaceae bacterium]|jgi:cell division transport system ATP-binding protein|nr:ATP-binding cassette domain-containing protein [Prevotellaceae bacterium]
MNDSVIIQTENLDVYQRGNSVLSDVNIKISRGEYLYLIGKTGAGKSSLLRTLYADLPVKEGKVYVAGYDVNGIESKDIPFLRRKIGMIFQDFQLISDLNIHDNLKFVLRATDWKNKNEIENKIDEVLDRVSLKEKKLKMPYQLSGGEQQRVAIARALLNDPDIILADEPTGNLDPDTSEEIIKELIEISKNGKAVLIATHDFYGIRKYPSRFLVCKDEKIFQEEL